MTAKKENIYVIYIGTTKLVALSGVIEAGEDITVNRFVKMLPVGFSEGVVTNVEKASIQIKKLVKELLQKDDFSKFDFQVVLSNKYIRNFLCSSSIYFGELMKPISMLDIENVITQTKSVATVPLDENIIEDAPEGFIVNDLEGIIDPLELEARRLGVNLRLFTVNNAVFRNISKVLERIDIIADAFLPKSLVSSYAVLRQEERSDGVIMVDIGGDVTGIIYFKNSSIYYYETLDLGSELISLELSKNLNISQSEAKRLKERYGSVALVSSFEDEIIPVVDVFGKTRLNLSKKRLYDHIFVATNTLIDNIKPVVDKISDEIGIVTGVVFTGGGASLDGILELAQEILGVPTRLGVSRKISGPKDVITSPQYTAIAGLLAYIAQQRQKDKERFRNKGLLTKKIEQVKEWIQNYF